MGDEVQMVKKENMTEVGKLGVGTGIGAVVGGGAVAMGEAGMLGTVAALGMAPALIGGAVIGMAVYGAGKAFKWW